MNKHTRLLRALDDLYGNDAQSSSTFRRVREYIDERTGEHVFDIEYRSKRAFGQGKQGDKKPRRNAPKKRKTHKPSGKPTPEKLIQQLIDLLA